MNKKKMNKAKNLKKKIHYLKEQKPKFPHFTYLIKE